MASSNNDETMEYDKQMHKKPDQPIIYLPEFANKLQQKANRTHIPPPPLTNSVHSQPDLEYNILDEIKRVHQLIKDNGQQGDFAMQIKFGELIPIYGTDRVDRLIEVLAVARKNGYINYTLKDFFQQDRDEDICIRSIKTPF